MKWKNIKLGGKFTFSFGLVIALLAVVAVWSIRGNYLIVGNAEEVIEGNKLRTNLEEKYVQHLKWAMALNDYITNSEVTELNVQTDHYKCDFGKWYYGEGRKHTEKIAPELKPVLAEFEQPHLHLHQSAKEIEKIFEETDNDVMAEKAAIDLFHQSTSKHLDKMGSLFTRTSTDSKEYIMTDEAMLSAANSTRIGTITLSAMAIFIGIIFAIIIARGIIIPIKNGVLFAKKISEGDLTVEVNIDQKDEIGQLASSLKDMSSKLEEIIGDVIQGANYIATASRQLSVDASEQAASTEEVSSSMEQMIANIQQNSQNAHETERIAQKASVEIGTGYQNVNQTVKSMREIAENITVVEEIAEKTDLLAINAAIEAARAGDHGKGFAVVAMEVRKLAERSQQAAAQINQVSKSSVSIAEETGRKMGEIVPEIEKTSTLVQEISAASREQNSGADQVNSALMQLNQSNQNTAASSEELAGQAAHLKDVISFFKTNHTNHKSNGQTKEIKKTFIAAGRQTPEQQPKLSREIDLSVETGSDSEFEQF